MKTVVYWSIFVAGIVVSALWVAGFQVAIAAYPLALPPADAGIFCAGGAILIIVLGGMVAMKATGGQPMRPSPWEISEGQPPKSRRRP